jgi:CDP-diacylglycerol---serine O-phosphatidyltransferase
MTTEDLVNPVDANPAKKPRHFSLLRSFSSADLITMGNAASGMAAIYASLAYLQTGSRREMWVALVLPFVALVCDVFDGLVARWTKRASAYGQDLDSLADIVSFGVAPAVIGYALGLSGGWDVAFLTYFVCCGIARLARFNVTAAALMTDKGKVSHFEGTPIPTSVLLVLMWMVAFGFEAVGTEMWLGSVTLGPAQWHPLSLVYALSGTGMVTATLRIPKP